MQIRIGNTIYNSDEEFIMLVLSDSEKKAISSMPEEKNKILFYKEKLMSDIKSPNLDKFMLERTRN